MSGGSRNQGNGSGHDGSAVEHCRATMAYHGKSFALASKLLPRSCRDDAAVVYAWCRRADDAIDLRSGAEQREALAELGAELSALYDRGSLRDDVPLQFREVAVRRQIPRAYPTALLAGMRMDVDGYQYRSVADLTLYAYRVASTVGLMMCHVMGVQDRRAFEHAAHLGLAMQLTNVCRDVAEDWRRGRLYLPDDVLARHGAPHLRATLGRELTEPGRQACRGALRELLSLADRYYASGDRGLVYLSPRQALAIDVARRVYSSIGTVIARHDHDIRAPRAVVPMPHKLACCSGALLAALRRRAFQARAPMLEPAQRNLPPRPSPPANGPPAPHGPEHGSELLTP